MLDECNPRLCFNLQNAGVWAARPLERQKTLNCSPRLLYLCDILSSPGTSTRVERSLGMFLSGRPGHEAAHSGKLYTANVYLYYLFRVQVLSDCVGYKPYQIEIKKDNFNLII